MLTCRVVKLHRHRIGAAKSAGFSLAEVACAIAITGLVLQGVVKGQELIHNARVRDVMAQQAAAEQAVLAFQDRFHALPGDYAEAELNIACGAGACPNGNGNGRVEPGTDGAIREDILAWAHLSGAGFLREGFEFDPFDSDPTPENSPTSVFGGFLQVAFDGSWGHNIKTGNYVPAAVLAEVDRKTDDGLPGSGRFRFSTYAGADTPPVIGECMDGGTPGTWRALDGSDNCGAATLLR